jgi:hypothetical protein
VSRFGTRVEHLSDRQIALLKHRKLRKYHDRLPGSGAAEPRSRGSLGQWSEWDTGTEATVAQQQEPGRGAGQRWRSQGETDLPNSHSVWVGELVEVKGLEPSTYGLQSRRSSS